MVKKNKNYSLRNETVNDLTGSEYRNSIYKLTGIPGYFILTTGNIINSLSPFKYI